jgi:hypothetical protein
MGGLLVFGIRSMNQPNSPAPVAQNSATAPLPVQAPPQISAEPPLDESEDEPEELALGEEPEESTTTNGNGDVLELDDGSDDLLAFGVPSDDAELDAWLEATDELLGEGG